MGQFVRMRTYPSASFRDVTAPNADTLYTTAWVDVGREPWILSLPMPTGDTYLFPMLDGWTNVFQVPATHHGHWSPDLCNLRAWLERQTASRRGKVPVAHLARLAAGPIYCTGTPEDYATVHKMQDAISLVPLSAYGKPYTPPAGKVDPSIDMKTAVRDQVNNLSAEEYFNLLAKLMAAILRPRRTSRWSKKMAKLGIVPGQPFDGSKLDPLARKGLSDVPKIANARIMRWMKEGILAGDSKLENGWFFTTMTGIYGTDYIQRALITAIGLGANRPQDAIYPTSEDRQSSAPTPGRRNT